MVEKLHPTPALGGHPRDKALEKIREEEKLDRGWYAAPVGWVNMNGDGEFAVAIRSGLVRKKSVSLFAGCGIVGDSDPENEYKETEMKFRPMLSALIVFLHSHFAKKYHNYQQPILLNEVHSSPVIKGQLKWDISILKPNK